jgi:lipopolysaccharide transport system ATP-binding protein
MSDIVIKAENLGKKYVIGHQAESGGYTALRDVLMKNARTLWNKIKDLAKGKPIIQGDTMEEVWALKDMSFEIRRGEAVGIIGRNGAGKSTLLKILSRITEPSTGWVTIKGRVASLLEVGTGFHPELSGRENIYLNGTILGMTRVEIKQKFDEIVAFAEVEKYLDTPVKRYSSGMYVRLAFAVAAHLEPEILVVDEVLAVGDAAFQKKCLGKMGDVAQEGRTVLFVSHNMNAIEQLCKHCILLEKGTIKQKGSNVSQIIKSYLFPSDQEIQPSQWINDGGEFENPWFKPKIFFITDAMGNSLSNPVSNNQDIWIQIEGTVDRLDPALEIGYSIYNEDGITLYWSYFNDQEVSQWPVFSRGEIILRTKIPRLFLNESIYTIELRVSLRCRMWITEPGKKSPSLNLMIRGGLSDGPYWTEKRQGVIAPLLEWKGKMKIQ